MEIRDFLKSYNIEFIEKDRKVLNGKELDIWIPSLNLAIEHNGLYWHSEFKKLDKNYHYKKWEECNSKGINLLTIWGDDWNYKKEIVKNIIINKLGVNDNIVYVTDTEIKIVDSKEKKGFLENNHLLGNIKGNISIGLFYQNELISIMVFEEKKEGDYEMLRFCNKINISVVYGDSKLFNYFLKKYNPNKIISYVNLDISDEEIYRNLGFNYLGFYELNHWWFKNGKREFNSNKVEDKIMRDLKYKKIWGSGISMWIYKHK